MWIHWTFLFFSVAMGQGMFSRWNEILRLNFDLGLCSANVNECDMSVDPIGIPTCLCTRVAALRYDAIRARSRAGWLKAEPLARVLRKWNFSRQRLTAITKAGLPVHPSASAGVGCDGGAFSIHAKRSRRARTYGKMIGPYITRSASGPVRSERRTGTEPAPLDTISGRKG